MELMGPIETMLQERVARGVALLDDKVLGWAERIRPRELNIAFPYQCLLGHLYRSYTTGSMTLKLGAWSPVDEHRAPSHYGFNYESASGAERIMAMKCLNQLWCKEVLKRAPFNI